MSDLPAAGGDGDDDSNAPPTSLDAGMSGRIDAGVATGGSNPEAGIDCADGGMGSDAN